MVPAQAISQASRLQEAPLDYIAAFDKVRVAELRKGRTTVIFDDLSAIFPKGRRLAVFGAQRSGKSTLINLLLGIRVPNRGRVIRNGSIAWPPSRYGVLDVGLSLRDNCIFLGQMYGRDIGALIDFMADMCEVPARKLSRPLSKLDVAVMRKTGVAACFAMDFDCYLFDDALSYNMVGFPRAIQDQMTQFLAKKTIVFATRTPAQTGILCNSGAILKGGRLAFYDDLKQAHDDYLRDPTSTAFNPFADEDDAGKRSQAPAAASFDLEF